MYEQKTSLIDQFSQAIESVKNRITGYNSKVSEFKQGVNANADKLRDLVERLRQCLQGLSSLKNNHDEFIRKLQGIYQNIDTERERALQDNSSDAEQKCNQKIETIYTQFKGLEQTLEEMDTDFTNTISEQLNALEGVIEGLCKEGDGLSSQISSSSESVGQEIDRLQSKVSAPASSAEVTTSETKLENTSAPGGRTVYINSAPSNTWKSAGDPPDIYYFRADGQPFNDGTGIVESSYTHPKDYPMQGGWLDARKLKSLSKSHPIRSLRKQQKKKRKTKKNILKKMRKKKRKTRKRKFRKKKRKTKKR